MNWVFLFCFLNLNSAFSKHLSNFVKIYRAYVKKYYLVSEESFIEKKKFLLFTKV